MHGKAFPVACIFSLLLVISICQASSVTRTFSKTAASTAENITVNLTVSITSSQDTYYAIDESYPSGWVVVSTTGDINQSGRVKWVVIEGAVSTNHTYVIRAPATTVTYIFSGLYMFNTTYPNELAILGQNQVTVTSSDTTAPNITFYPPTPSNNTDVLTNYIYVNVGSSEDLGNCILNWYNGTWTNLSMTVDSGLRLCYRNMTGLSNGTYQFRVYATDLVGNMNVTPGTRQNTIVYSPPPAPFCGDGACNGAESCSSCPGDCGQCPAPPSDGGDGGGGGGGGGAVCISGQTRSCSVSYQGYCASGNETCVNGNWEGCAQPMTEICNRIDDNCDGMTDEGITCECFIGESRPCGSNIGECREGTQMCINSFWDTICHGEKKPILEVCNGADDDCDGTVDEGCKEQLSFKPCPDGEIPSTGCICEEKIYDSGFCFSNKYYDGTVIRDYTMPIIGAAFVLIFAVVFIRWRHRKLKT